MTTFHLIFKEFIHRKLNSLLSSLAIVTAVSLFVLFFTTGLASRQETKRIMRDMGQNLRIIPKATVMDKFWSMGFSEHTMPEEYVYRFAAQEGFSYTHLTATLQKKVSWRGKEVILTGILPEVLPPDKLNQKPMVFSVKPGTVYVGFELAGSLAIKRGDEIDIFGKPFIVESCLSESGSDDDIRIYGHLNDIQSLLGLEGRINEIKALECLCILGTEEAEKDPRVVARQQLAEILPEAKVILIQSIAEARQKQRVMVEKHLAFIMSFVLVVCAVWVGVLAMINVRERRYEIGIMRALGYGSNKIVLLFLGKAATIGVIGAVIGFGIGTGFTLLYGPEIFKVTATMIKPVYWLFGWALIAAPGFAALSSFIPAMIAITEDPAITLMQE